MRDMISMIREAAPFAAAFALAGGGMAGIIISAVRRRKVSVLLTLMSALYLGFLLHGTVVGRLSSWSDLLEWRMPDFNTVWWQFELGARTHSTAVHAVLNAALFVPWGLLGMCWQRRPGAGFLVLLSGVLMSAGIEFFQVTHGMVFDLGDVLTNSIGTAAGCIAGIPALLFNRWMYERRKNRGKRRTIGEKKEAVRADGKKHGGLIQQPAGDFMARRRSLTMNIGLESNIIKHYLRDVYFINGTAYAGKSTMVHMLAEKYGMIECGENYHLETARQIAEPDRQPATCYFSTMSGWEEFLNRTPEEYAKWIEDGQTEIAQFEIAELIRLSAQGKKIIVDTNIPPEILWKISDYDHVAVMLSPQSMSVERFFDRSDPDKQFLLKEIDKCPDPEKTMANFRACLARVNSPEVYDHWRRSGFFTHVRRAEAGDTREETMRILAEHFGLEER